MILENCIKFIKYFGHGKKLKLAGFSLMSLIAGALEFFGIALIYPFIIMIIKPESVMETGLYKKFIILTHVSDPLINALILGGLALILFVIKNVYMILFLRVQNNFIQSWRLYISNLFMKYFLYAPYQELIKYSNSDKYYILNNLCTIVLNGFVVRCLTLMTNFIIVVMVICLIMVKYPAAGVTAIIFALGSLFIQNKYLKNATLSIRDKIQSVSRLLNSITCSNIDNTKEIKIISAEDIFFNRFTLNGKRLSCLEADREFYAGIPPYIVEMLIVLSLLILGGFIAFGSIQDRSAMVASFAMVVACIFRIAPALNRIQTSIININTSRNYLKALIGFYEDFGLDKFHPLQNKEISSMSFNDKIELRNICFSYKKEKPVLNNISFEICKGDFIGIIGLSGSGKTTLADVFMGLLHPDCGEIIVDGVKLTENNYHNFRNIIGYVPQEVRLLESSIKENIAWCVDKDKIDDNKIWHAVGVAQLCDFVNQFPEGLDAEPFVGTFGASQGQKQRIQLARVLYRNPEILVLDEATSSLDVKVEHEITGMLNNLKNKKTIIAIAHRLSTLKSCNKLIYIKDGRVVDIGTFKDLSEKYEDFDTLVKLSSVN